jgi:ribosome-binding factor A
MVSQARAARVAQRIKEELSEMILFDISDPRLQDIFVTYVRVDRELAFANIFVSALEGSEREPEIMEGLQSAAGFLRRQLAQRIQLRSFPQLRFTWDPIPENAERIDRLIDSLKPTEESDEG